MSALGSAQDYASSVTRVIGRATSVVRSRIELTQQQQSILQFLLLAHPTVGVSGYMYQIMMKKTCPVLLAIARQRSRLLGVIIEHHAAANVAVWSQPARPRSRVPSLLPSLSGVSPSSHLEAVVARGTVESSISVHGKAGWALPAGH